MVAKRKLFTRVEQLLINLLDEAEKVIPPVLDADGNETAPAKVGTSFGERLKLAEVATNFELRRRKAEEDTAPDEMADIVQEYQRNAGRASKRGREGRAAETNGIANFGRALPAYAGASADDDRDD